MEKVKKLWKEISIFGIVLVVFIGLFVYFVVVIGNNSDNTTLSYQQTMTTFVEKNRSKSLYYVDVSGDSDYTTWLEEKLDITDGTVPQTLVYEKGKVKTAKTGALSYYRLSQLYK